MASTAVALHVVALPYPGRGHINPMLAVCRLLVAADSALTVTIVVTEEWLGLLASAGVPPTLPDCISLATIPNVTPSERVRWADMAGFFDGVCGKMGEHVEQLLDRLALERRRPEAQLVIVADTFLTWAVAAGARRGIPVCSLWTQPATFFLALYHLDLWPPVDDGMESEEVELSSMESSLEQYIPAPGLSSVRLSDLKTISTMERPMEIVAESLANLEKAQCVLFTSFHELEPLAFNAITELLPCPAYPIGPSVPRNFGDKISDGEHRAWLDAQPDNSVLYVSFGSFISMPPSQLQEIATGLRDSGISFFWVARDKAAGAGLQQMCADGRGLAVPWCEQQEVLCHPSIGGFLSHCGWNSVLEAVCGVPLLAFPLVWDQLVNARMVADQWKVGINLREQIRGEDGSTVSSAATSAAVRKLMDPDSGVGQEMRRRATQLREHSSSALQEGGSSLRSFTRFLQELLEGRH